MTQLPQSLQELQAVFDCWAQSFQKIKSPNERIAFTRAEMPTLLLNRRLLKKILTHIVRGRRYPDVRQATMFLNEFVLYINPQRLFSARLYLYELRDNTHPSTTTIHGGFTAVSPEKWKSSDTAGKTTRPGRDTLDFGRPNDVFCCRQTPRWYGL